MGTVPIGRGLEAIIASLIAAILPPVLKSMTASAPVSGLHFVFKIDPHKVNVETPRTTGICDGFALTTKKTGDKLHLFLYSLDGKTLPIGTNQIVTIPIAIPKALQEADAFQIVQAFAGTEGAQRLQTFIGERAIETALLPESFTLHQNNPNPFNMMTNISYDVPNIGKAVPVKLYIYNLKGQLIRKLEDRVREAGHYTVQWNGTDDFGEIVSTGIYFAKFAAENVVLTKKLALMK